MSSLSAHLQKGGQLLSPLNAFEVLSPRITRILGMNPSPYTLTGTNCYLIGSGPSRILVDTGEGLPQFVDVLEAAMVHIGCSHIQEIIISHWHRDHIGGVPSLRERFGSDIPVKKFPYAQLSSCSEVGEGGEGGPPDFIVSNEGFVPLSDGDRIATQGATLRVLHTPGHASDHIALLLEEESALFSGDNILGTGTCIINDLDLYLKSLRRYQSLGGTLEKIYPGHGPVVDDGRKKVDDYIAHREHRVTQVRDALRSAKGGAKGRNWWYSEEVARAVYGDDLAPSLLPAATNNTILVLNKLAASNEVVLLDNDGGKAGGFQSRWSSNDASRTGGKL